MAQNTNKQQGNKSGNKQNMAPESERRAPSQKGSSKSNPQKTKR